MVQHKGAQWLHKELPRYLLVALQGRQSNVRGWNLAGAALKVFILRIGHSEAGACQNFVKATSAETVCTKLDLMEETVRFPGVFYIFMHKYKTRQSSDIISLPIVAGCFCLSGFKQGWMQFRSCCS